MIDAPSLCDIGPLGAQVAAARHRLRRSERDGSIEPLLELGNVYRRCGDYSGARRVLAHAVALQEHRVGPEHVDVTTSLNDLGLLLDTMGEYAEARALHERALHIRRRTLREGHPWIAISLNNLALVFRHTGEYQRARTLYEEALALRERHYGRNSVEVAQTLDNLALVLRRTGDYPTARRYYEKAFSIRQRALGNVHVDLAESANNIASLLRSMGDYTAALERHKQAIVIWENAVGNRHPNIAIGLNNFALTLEAMGEMPNATTMYERAVELREHSTGRDDPELATLLNNLARARRLAGDADSAERLYRRALDIRERRLPGDHDLVGLSLTALADMLREGGRREEAQRLYSRALPIAMASPVAEWTWRTFLGAGLLEEQAQRFSEAVDLYRAAVDRLDAMALLFQAPEERRRFLTAESRPKAYEALARALLELHRRNPGAGYDWDAWDAIETRKAKLVSEILLASRRGVVVVPTHTESGPLHEHIEASQRRLGEAASRLQAEQERPATARQEAERWTREVARTKGDLVRSFEDLVSRYPADAARYYGQHVVDPRLLAKILNQLPSDTFAVQYFTTPEVLYIFVLVPPNGFRVVQVQVKRAELEQLVRRYRELVQHGEERALRWHDGTPSDAEFQLITETLGRYLLSSVTDELTRRTRIILLPNDFLFHLPIHALTWRSGEGVSRFLAETHETSYLTQMELAVLSREAEGGGASLLAIANPDGTLPGANQEVEGIPDSGRRVTRLEGRRATKAQFLQLASQHVDFHFATHGVLDPERPEHSYLAMAGSDPQSQRLTIGEIQGLQLRPGLAILSACSTAVSESQSGAALMTLAAAFSQAGSSSIVASLWRVHDESTRNFMIIFHQQLMTSPRAVALRTAQLALLRDRRTAHPYYWAAFMLIGAR